MMTYISHHDEIIETILITMPEQTENWKGERATFKNTLDECSTQPQPTP